MELDKKIEAILFFKGEQLSIPKIGELLGEGIPNVEAAISKLDEDLKKRGVGSC